PPRAPRRGHDPRVRRRGGLRDPPDPPAARRRRRRAPLACPRRTRSASRSSRGRRRGNAPRPRGTPPGSAAPGARGTCVRARARARARADQRPSALTQQATRPMVRPMRAIQVLLAATALVLIGAVEAAASARQLAAQAGRGRPTLSGEGAALTLAGLALSVAVYLVLGRAVGRSGGPERAAVAEGVASGILAGAVGGSLRALAVSDYLGEQVGRLGLPAR